MTEAHNLDLLREVYLVRRVGSVDRVSAIHLESIDYLDKTFKYNGKRYPISAFNQWVYVADTEKDVDYIRFFAHYGNYTMLIERERVHRECLSLLEGIMANIKADTASIYSIHNELSTCVSLLERDPCAYKAEMQKVVYEEVK